jgi:hypothetical protein
MIYFSCHLMLVLDPCCKKPILSSVKPRKVSYSLHELYVKYVYLHLFGWRGGREVYDYILRGESSKILGTSDIDYTVTYSGFSIHDGTLLHSKSQYTTVKQSRQLLEHTYTSDPHGLGTPTPIEFFQQDLLWQYSNTRFHSCSQKAFKHTWSIRRRAIGALAHRNGTSAHSPSLACHLPAPTIEECLHRPPYKLVCSSRPTYKHVCGRTIL